MSRPPAITDISAALVQRAFPTVAVWNRVGGRARPPQSDRALTAEIRDPQWMLARQWQFGEFRGEDAGSPVSATFHVSTAAPTRYRGRETAPRPLPGTM